MVGEQRRIWSSSANSMFVVYLVNEMKMRMSYHRWLDAITRVLMVKDLDTEDKTFPEEFAMWESEFVQLKTVPFEWHVSKSFGYD